MFTEQNIKVKNTETGVYLSAETDCGHYGQAYNITNKTAANYVGSVAEAKQRFVKFYNKFEIKTYKQWTESKKDLNEFLQVGDAVDEEILDYFIGVLPPACQSPRCVQIGEPYSQDAGGLLFETLEKQDGQWIYTGHKNTPKTEKCLYVS